MSFSLSLHFLPVLSLQTSVCSTLKFYPVFSGVTMSIRSFFLFSTYNTLFRKKTFMCLAIIKTNLSLSVRTQRESEKAYHLQIFPEG